MEKVLFLSQQRNADRQDKDTVAEQASRLTHAIMNQLTVIYLSCAKLRHRLAFDPSPEPDPDILTIESAVQHIASQAEALLFRLEKTTRRQTKGRSAKSQKRLPSKTSFSVIPPREKP